jgi:prepilin-type N-terminal cleavage/methylation domain-containing protein
MHLTPLSQPRRSARSDSGFTLIELLITIAILGVIAYPLSNAVIGLLKNMDAGNARLTASNSGQMGASYFAQDVETLGAHDYESANAPHKASVLLAGVAGATCGTSGTSAVVRLLSDSHDANSAVHSVVVSWAVVTSSAGSTLVRTRCVDGVKVAELPIADKLSGTPTITCSSTCGSTTVPDTVTLTYTVAPAGTTAYTVSLTGVRRQT